MTPRYSFTNIIRGRIGRKSLTTLKEFVRIRFKIAMACYHESKIRFMLGTLNYFLYLFMVCYAVPTKILSFYSPEFSSGFAPFIYGIFMFFVFNIMSTFVSELRLSVVSIMYNMSFPMGIVTSSLLLWGILWYYSSLIREILPKQSSGENTNAD